MRKQDISRRRKTTVRYKVQRELTSANPYRLFLYALNSPVTRKRYSTRLRYFFVKIGLTDNNNNHIEELCRAFIEKGNQDPNWIINNIVSFLTEYKDRYDRREISGSTIRNYVKVVKLLCEMNDIVIPWKKITRGLPKGSQWADDRAPSIDEIRKLCEYPDRRIKPLVYTMCSSGIRLGAWDYLRWQDVSPIINNGEVIAAKLTIYAGEEDQYYAHCTPEAYSALKSWMDYREASGEKITGKSWIMRDLWATLDPRINGSINVLRKKKSSGIKRLIENAWYSQGLRKPLEEGKTRHEFQAVHGFRKFYKTVGYTGSISCQCLSMSNSCTLYIVAQCSTLDATIIQWQQEDSPEDNSDNARTG